MAEPSKKRKTTPSTSSTPSAPPPFFGLKKLNAEQKQLFSALANRNPIATKFASPATLNDLGLTKPVTRLLARVGLADFFSMHAHTYAPFTIEFLATLQKGVDENADQDTDGRFITFHLQDKKYRLFYLS